MGSEAQITLDPVARTAIDVAVERAREATRPDAPFLDPYASGIVSALGGRLDAFPAMPPEASVTLAFHVAIRTRFFDDHLKQASAAGCRQVVLLGCGLDTRAFRLDWPAGVRVFEVDLPNLMNVKNTILNGIAASPRCERIAIGLDLRGDLGGTLLNAGLDPSQPIAWLAEGLLIYLSATEATALLQRITDLSSSGSTLACERANFADAATLELANSTLGMGHVTGLWKGGLGYDVAEWLPTRGWDVHSHDVPELAKRYGRTPPDQASGALLTATYRS